MSATPAAMALPQVNLFNAALVPKREAFTARHIAFWSVVAALAMAVLGWQASTLSGQLRREVAEHAARMASESARALTPRLPSGEVAPTPQQVTILEQTLRERRAALQARSQARDTLKRGHVGPNEGPSAVLRQVAATLPPAAWITQLRAAGGRFDASGRTLDAASVDTWLESLRGVGLLAALPQPSVRVERIEAPTPAGGAVPVYVFSLSAPLAAPLAEDGGRP